MLLLEVVPDLARDAFYQSELIRMAELIFAD
jgi:hypothetical protein